jgi:uncharacterized protein YjbI with pentapeptide repeats
MAVDRLRSAADAAANDAEGSYLRFAVFGLYLAVVVGATTHEELLKGSVVTMPGLGVGLPIMGFYVLVPALFVLMHSSLLLQLSLVSGHVERLRAAIQDLPSDEERQLERALPPSSIISQFLFGAHRSSSFGMIFAFVISLVLLPIGILTFVQVRFLPYHSEWVTGWHRVLILADLLVIWLLWPRIVRAASAPARANEADQEPALPRGWGEALRRSLAQARDVARQRRSSTTIVVIEKLAAWARNEAARFPRRLGRHPGLLAISLVTVVFVTSIATIPESAEPVAASSGDPCEDDALADEARAPAAEPVEYAGSDACRPLLIWRYFARVRLPVALVSAPPRIDYCLTYLLFEAPTTPLNMRRNLRVRNARLVPAEPSAADLRELGEREAWNQVGRGLDLKGRDLRFADFTGSDLRKSDLRGADLFGANLASAKLRYATAADVPVSEYDGCSRALQVGVDGQTYCRTRISDAKLQAADLRDASFWRTAMERADLSYGKLERAVLDHADLAGGDLQYADLRGARLFGARLDDAKLSQARLDGANLSCAWARNADLEAAELPMAVLLKARLEGAKLRDAGLEGAYLAQARLSQAELAGSYFAGADLRAAVLEDARFGAWPSELPFFGWANLQAVEGQPAYGPEALKEGPDTVWRRIAPEALVQRAIPALVEAAYQDRLATLLTGRVCDPAADAHELQGLATRVLWDKDVIKEVTAFHKKVALGLLRAAAEVAPDGGAEDATGPPLCPQAAAMPPGMRDGLRSLLTTPLGSIKPSDGP